ncbi:hypothetical protein IQ277_24540 [Nostocales cyanobacterium LEGE 12452]|nr:hypothetical protein [Nostocales cyanobacterium LEGE 12452]
MRNTPLAGILGLITFVFAANSFFLDATSTAQNIAWFYKWSKTSNIDQSLRDWGTQINLFFNTYGFYFLVAILAFIVYRRD